MALIDQAFNAAKGLLGGRKSDQDDLPVESMKDDDFVKEADALYKLISQKYIYERQWYLNLSFLLGQQYVEWSNQLKRLQEPKVPKWRVRHVANDIMPTYRQDLSKLNKNRPTMYISAGKKGPAGDLAAKEANHMVEYWWSSPVIEMENELLEWKQFMMSCGTGFLKPYWDPTVGTERSKPDPATGEDVVWRDGEVMLEACSPFEIVFDPPDAKKFKDLRKIMHYKVRSLEYIKARYPGTGDKVVDEKETNLASSFWQKIQGMTGSGSEGAIAMPEKADKSAIVKEMWVWPCAKYPKGQKIVVANSVLLEKKDLPYTWLGTEEPFVPIVPLYEIKPPGRVWGRSKIEDEIPIQKAKNELISHIRESERLCSKPKFLKPLGSAVDNITSEPGENVEWDPTQTMGHKPGWLVPPPIPQYVITGLSEIYQRDFANVASRHEVSKGQTPPGVSSGIAISHLQEQDDTIIGDVARQYERQLEIVGNMMLSLASQNYKENRTLQITEEDGTVDDFEFKVRKEQDGTVIEEGTIPEKARLKVEAGSALPRTQVARQAFIIDLHDKGILGPVGDPATNKRTLRLLEMGNTDELYEEEAADRSQAEIENEAMRGGVDHAVYPYQDHEVHLHSHEMFMKKPEFMQLNENIRVLFETHRKVHQEFLIPPEPPPEVPAE